MILEFFRLKGMVNERIIEACEKIAGGRVTSQRRTDDQIQRIVQAEQPPLTINDIKEYVAESGGTLEIVIDGKEVVVGRTGTLDVPKAPEVEVEIAQSAPANAELPEASPELLAEVADAFNGMSFNLDDVLSTQAAVATPKHVEAVLASELPTRASTLLLSKIALFDEESKEMIFSGTFLDSGYECSEPNCDGTGHEGSNIVIQYVPEDKSEGIKVRTIPSSMSVSVSQ